MNHPIKFFSGILLLLLAAGCSLFSKDEDDCDLAPGLSADRLFNKVTVTGDHIWCDEVPYGQTVSIGARYFASNCVTSKEEVWSFPEGTTYNTQTFESVFEQVRLTQSGQVCVYIKTNKGDTEKFCRNVIVSRANSWATIPTTIISQRVRMISMVIDGVFYAGFGVHGDALNLQYRKDWFMMNAGTSQFLQITPNISDVNFTAIAGFGIGNRGYIVGNNSKVYSFNPTSGSWAELGNFPENVYTAFLSDRWDRENPVVSLEANSKGYFGLGKTNRWLEYDPAVNTWTEKSAYPGTRYQYPIYFSYQGKCYVGDKIYDPTTDSWSNSPLAALNGYAGHWLPIGDHIYLREGYKTYKIAIATGAKTEITKPQNPCFGEEVNGKLTRYAVSGVVGTRGYVITTRPMTTAEDVGIIESYTYYLD